MSNTFRTEQIFNPYGKVYAAVDQLYSTAAEKFEKELSSTVPEGVGVQMARMIFMSLHKAGWDLQIISGSKQNGQKITLTVEYVFSLNGQKKNAGEFFKAFRALYDEANKYDKANEEN